MNAKELYSALLGFIHITGLHKKPCYRQELGVLHRDLAMINGNLIKVNNHITELNKKIKLDADLGRLYNFLLDDVFAQ